MAKYLESDVLERVWGPTESGIASQAPRETPQGRACGLLEGIYVLIAVVQKVGVIMQANQQGASDSDPQEDRPPRGAKSQRSIGSASCALSVSVSQSASIPRKPCRTYLCCLLHPSRIECGASFFISLKVRVVRNA